ncbi:hypothetical protein CDAR_581171 [Caerostris darwini]|uniref:Uncharacterized protein n=1 Tax=Caerostris darwini TaxID=1538125 RepID=A0AAV4MK43_9ARAC|nr:hypothetical protein CDAR_581171 [Caerostris darwini]
MPLLHTFVWVDSYRLLVLPLASEGVSRHARDLNMDLRTFSGRNTPSLIFQEGSRDVLISIQGGRAANKITGVFLLGWGLQTHCYHGRNLRVLQKFDFGVIYCITFF